MDDDLTTGQESTVPEGFLGNPMDAVFARAFVEAKAVWDDRVNSYVAAARRLVAEHREAHALPSEAPVTVTPSALMYSYVARAFADDPTVTVVDPT
jgi:hypothetical protein